MQAVVRGHQARRRVASVRRLAEDEGEFSEAEVDDDEDDDFF